MYRIVVLSEIFGWSYLPPLLRSLFVFSDLFWIVLACLSCLEGVIGLGVFFFLRSNILSFVPIELSSFILLSGHVAVLVGLGSVMRRDL